MFSLVDIGYEKSFVMTQDAWTALSYASLGAQASVRGDVSPGHCFLFNHLLALLSLLS